MFRNILKVIPPAFVILLLLLTQNMFAQAAAYTFNQAAGTYTAITGGTVLWTGTFDDDFSTAVTMPAFNFSGTTYTTIYISANGYVTLGTASLGYTPISSTTVSPGVFSVFGRDLNNAATGIPEVRYQTVGNEFIVQWQDVRRYNVTGEIFSCQLRLNSSNNTIKFVYGGTITPGSNTIYPQIGLRGAVNTDFNNRKIATGGGDWINSLAGTVNTDVMFFNSSDLTTVPSVGLTYTFTPPNYPPSISYTLLTNTTGTGNRNLNGVVITDLNGIASGSLSPRIYWRVNGGSWVSAQTSSGSSPYNFTISTTGLSVGDLVEYFVVAQDLLGAVGANPSAGFTAVDVNNITTYPTTPNTYHIVNAPLAGNYTVGVAEFNKVTGKNIYFQKVVNKVWKQVDVEVPIEVKQFAKGQEQKSDLSTPFKTITQKQFMEVEEITWIPMENGQPYTGDLYVKKSESPQYVYPDDINGIYATITLAVADLNLRGVSAAVNFLLTDATYPSETLPIIVDVNSANMPTSTNKVTIKPNSGVSAYVSGAGASTQVIKILTSYVNIDGSNSGGTDRSLTIENTSITSPQVVVVGSKGTSTITGVTVKNCIIINGANTSSALIISDGATPGNPGYFTNITLQNNSVQKAYIGVYCNAAVSTGNGNGLLLTGNDLSTSGVNAIRLAALYVQGADGATLSNNILGNFTTSDASNITGIWFATGTVNSTISNNTLGPIASTSGGPRGIVISSGASAANINITNNIISGMTTTSTGTTYGVYVFSTTGGVTVQKNKISNIKNTNTGGYSAIGISLYSTLASANITAVNNFIWDVAGYGWSSLTTDNGYGIQIGGGGGYNLYFNSVAMTTEQTLATGEPSALLIGSAITPGSLDIRDNIFANFLTVGSQRFAVICNSANTIFTNINYNDYYTVGPNLGYLGINILDIGAWRTATAQDANSFTVDPGFVSNTDLHIAAASGIKNHPGFSIASVTTDIDGNARGNPPGVGADEYVYVPPAVLDPTNVLATPISASQIDVSFTPNANNNNVVIVFNLTGTFTTPVGAPPAIGQPFAGGTLIYNGTTSPKHHTGLNPVTTYYYKLFSYNGSLYSAGMTASATTPCGAISSFPWTEGFESMAIVGSKILPNCWSYENVAGTSGPYSSNTSGTYYGPHSGTTFIYTYYANTTWVFTPGFSLTAGTSYDFSFWMMNKVVTNPVDFLMDVAYGTSQNGVGMTNVLATGIVCNNSSYVQFTYTFTPSASGTYYFGVKSTSATSTPWYLSFDDFRFEPTPSCPMPTGLNVTGITNTGAYIGWSNAALVDIDYGTPGHPAGTGTVVPSINTNPYHLTGLSAYTPYDVYVRQNCGGGSYSTWAGPLNFTTAANPLTVPYSQNFDESTIPAGWTQSGTDWSVSNSNNAGGSPYEMMDSWFSYIGATRLIAGPFNTSGLAALKLAFKHFFNDYGPGVTVKIQSSTDGGTWTDEAYSFASGGGDIGPETVYTTIANNVGTITYIAWVIDGDHFQLDYYYIDDVVVSIPYPNDVGMVSIDIPSSLPGGPITPQATVKNFGTNTNSFNVQLTITGGYSSTKSVTNLAPGATQQVTFDNWNATNGVFTAQACTQLGSDQDPTNDCMSKLIGVITGSWAGGSSFPDGTYLGVGVSDGTGNVYSIGGNTNSGLLTECYKYNVATNTWSTIAPLPAGRRVLAGALVGNFIYAIGGSDASSVYQTTVYKYDIAGNSWSTVAALPLTIGWGKAVGYNNNYIYLAGGYDGVATVLSSVYVYNISANTWTAATSMPGPKFGGAFNIVGNKLVYVAGADDITISSSVYVGTIDAGNPLLITWATMANPYPGLKETVYSEYAGKLTALLRPKEQSKNHLPTDASSYPPGAMYRFDAEPWGTDGIIVASGSPSASWIPANPNPCFVYKPGTDTWIPQYDVPYPVLGASLGSVSSGNTWKLVIISGLDLSGLSSDTTQIYTDNLGGTNTFPLSVNIAQGWNMVSVPGTNPDGMDITHWWINHTGTVYKFIPGSGYSGIATTIPGQGYWEKNTVNQTYNTGDEWPAGGIQLVNHDPINAALGWNMFGGYEDIVDPLALTTVPAGKIVYPIYKFVPGSGYTSTAQIVPGYGYWVKVSAACQIIVPNVMAKSNQKMAELFKDDWGKIILTDAAGSSYTLYAVKGDVDLNQYELPPLPPAGLFDVRFGSSRVAEDINTDFKSIEMRGITYPVRIKADGMDIRLMDVSGKLINTNVKDGEEITIDNANIDKVMVSGQLIPDKYSLEQNYPNPFNPSTTIQFSLPENVKNVRISVYNVLGQKVAELVNGEMLAGKYQYQWNAKNFASGMYIYELRTEKFVSIKKMMLLK